MMYNLRAAFAATLLLAASITPSRLVIGQSNAAETIAQSVVYQPGEEGYPRYRIPAVVQTKQGTLLAFCEGRTGGDSGPIDLVLKRSSDDGRTWGPLQVVWDDGDNTCGNPCPVVDQQTGTIWLLMTWNLGTDHERAIMDGTSKDVRHVYVTHSKDDGLTWATPTKISDSTRHSRWRAGTRQDPAMPYSSHEGAHAGRLLIPANHSDHDDQGHPYRSHVIYSDDHGETWELGGIQQDKTNESAVVELIDGSVLQAMRSYHGKNRRAMATSKDGGETWGDVYLDDALDTPVCQASIMRYSWPNEAGDGKSRILFASPRGKSRSQMTVWMSYDEGKTWPISKLIDPGSAAYSNLIPLPNDRIGLIFERDDYQSIAFATFSMAWMEQ